MEKAKYVIMFQEVKLESMRAIIDKMKWDIEYDSSDDETENAAKKEIYENIIELIATLKPSK